ncbi:MAG: hypothetical protein AB7K09_07825, partial [Planctomycetota bacterium]
VLTAQPSIVSIAAAVAVLLLASPTHPAAAGDSWDSSTQRAGLSVDYGFSLSSLGGPVQTNLGLKSPGIGFLNLGLGFQFDELLELHFHGYLEDCNAGGSTTRETFGVLFGLRLHVLPGNTYNYRVPNMADLFVDVSFGFSELGNRGGTGYINGLELRLGGGLRGSFDMVGKLANDGVFWTLMLQWRVIQFGDLEINYVNQGTVETLSDVVGTLGLGIMF